MFLSSIRPKNTIFMQVRLELCTPLRLQACRARLVLSRDSLDGNLSKCSFLTIRAVFVAKLALFHFGASASFGFLGASMVLETALNVFFIIFTMF